MKTINPLTAIFVSSFIFTAGQAGAAPPSKTTPTGTYEFAGFSSTVVVGNVGIAGLNAACGPDARACFSQDILDSRPTLGDDGGPAWVIPSIIAVRGDGALVDVSGIQAGTQELTCNGWTSATPGSSDRGLTVNNNLGFGVLTCSETALPVACCQPQ